MDLVYVELSSRPTGFLSSEVKKLGFPWNGVQEAPSIWSKQETKQTQFKMCRNRFCLLMARASEDRDHSSNTVLIPSSGHSPPLDASLKNISSWSLPRHYSPPIYSLMDNWALNQHGRKREATKPQRVQIGSDGCLLHDHYVAWNTISTQ